ncbi:MAG: hypothetical protein QOH58_2758 [Thermoleophilaceae bacterium]|jgi:hypothetical protein|nr:hypothetical protein [Thermoleophilaceae bacterium]
MGDGEFRIVSPGGSLGYGVNAESLELAVKSGLDAIGADSGSTDMGAFYLGAPQAYHSRTSMKRDLSLVLGAAVPRGLPVLIGNAGGAGANWHLEWMRKIVLEVAKEQGLEFKLAVIHSEQDPEYLKRQVQAGKVTPMAGVPELEEERVDACVRLVAQMGMEPFIEALDAGADVVLAGRACDTAIFASGAVRQGFDEGLALHIGKILECGAMSAVPPTGRDCIVAALGPDSFEISAPNPAREVTPYSVAAHMVYEVEDPNFQGEPTGVLDFSNVELSATGNRSTSVAGTKYHLHERPTLRFEGAEKVGYRSFLLGGIRDPFLIARIDEYIDGCTAQTRELMGDSQDYKIEWVVYGRDGVMGELEPKRDTPGHELGVMVEVLAQTQELAHDVAALLEARMIGFAYTGAKTRTGHVAFPFSPLVHDTGPVYKFSVLHIAELADAEDLTRLFPIDYEEVR